MPFQSLLQKLVSVPKACILRPNSKSYPRLEFAVLMHIKYDTSSFPHFMIFPCMIFPHILPSSWNCHPTPLIPFGLFHFWIVRTQWFAAAHSTGFGGVWSYVPEEFSNSTSHWEQISFQFFFAAKRPTVFPWNRLLPFCEIVSLIFAPLVLSLELASKNSMFVVSHNFECLVSQMILQTLPMLPYSGCAWTYVNHRKLHRMPEAWRLKRRKRLICGNGWKTNWSCSNCWRIQQISLQCARGSILLGFPDQDLFPKFIRFPPPWTAQRLILQLTSYKLNTFYHLLNDFYEVYVIFLLFSI